MAVYITEINRATALLRKDNVSTEQRAFLLSLIDDMLEEMKDIEMEQ